MMTLPQKYISKSVGDTHEYSFRLAAKLLPGQVIVLFGELGSGKTTFVQGLAKALKITKRITSPTFIIMRQYQTPIIPGDFYHLDLYRISSSQDIATIDLESLFAENSHLFAIEWPESILSLLPPSTIYLHFAHLGGNIRSIINKSASFTYETHH